MVPGLCRTAVEAAFTQAFWRRELSAGQTRAVINARLVRKPALPHPHRCTRHVRRLDEGGRGARAGRWGKIHADTYRALNKGAHEPYAGDLTELISNRPQLGQEDRGKASVTPEQLLAAASELITRPDCGNRRSVATDCGVAGTPGARGGGSTPAGRPKPRPALCAGRPSARS